MTPVTKLTKAQLLEEWRAFLRDAADKPDGLAPPRALELSRELIRRGLQGIEQA